MRRLGEDATLFEDVRVGYVGADVSNGMMDPALLAALTLHERSPQP
jgi:hypothetical protein